MFESLSTKLNSVFGRLRSKGRLTEGDIDAAALEIRMALLEADVNLDVVKEFLKSVKTAALSSEVMNSLTPAENVVKIVLDELTKLLGTHHAKLELGTKLPHVIVLVGLQGSGKTTASAKLAIWLKKQGHHVLLAAADIYRPAAIEQLKTLGSETDTPVYSEDNKTPVEIAKNAVSYARKNMLDVVIVDTAGRTQVDETMMVEAADIVKATKPDATLMIVDSMSGQDAVNSAKAFNERVNLAGLVLTKLDGDARGGAALSAASVTGKPILFVSEGEAPSAISEFYPDRLAKRILGMGDVVSLIEKASEVAEADQLAMVKEAKKELSFNDLVEMNQSIKKMGGLGGLLKALPGGDAMLSQGAVDDGAIDKMTIIINSMTRAEREKPSLLNGNRRARIAKGAGVTIQAVNQLVAQMAQMTKMYKKMAPTQEAMAGGKKGRPTKGGKGKKKNKGGVRGSMQAINSVMPGGLGGLGDMSKLLKQAKNGELGGLEDIMKGMK